MGKAGFSGLCGESSLEVVARAKQVPVELRVFGKKHAKNKPAMGPIPIEEGGNLWRKMSNEKKHLVV